MTVRGSAGWLESDGLTALDAGELARLVDRTSERELRHRLIGGVREIALREIFRRMPEYLRPARAAGFDAVISWQITGAGGGGRRETVDEYWLRVHDGRCTLESPGATPPDITIRTDPTTLLRIVTGNEDPVLAVLKQRLSVRGDLAQAARLPKLFSAGPL
ncbi:MULTISPECIES: SCP2 sterol-binding domain-containing protein [Kribbella]|uniref:SCP2 sterol-binding domain-containing protein n=2 Tax=Kribbella TaxID=182639 RepID=A0A4R0J1G6_9ACTN|nr:MULTISPECIES: SCP2 sterol-binding domain-containing protein [Kribbella]TCC27522.1 SCP2 sterol-binding domain-containing protein [Kribbella speibonae]TCC34975.1 SCP2 sterol-binding domain-containing protein [Kribbella sindirgiensis]